VAKFRKKPVVVEAFQMTEQARRDTRMWPSWLTHVWASVPDRALSVGSVGPVDWEQEFGPLRIRTLEGTMVCNLGDWIIRGVNGELYPCKPDIFEKTYEPA